MEQEFDSFYTKLVGLANKIDDYLYDVVKKERGIDLSSEDMAKINDRAIELAVRNNEFF